MMAVLHINIWKLLIFAICINAIRSANTTNSITNPEGTENVQIACEFSLDRAPVWRINDTLYDPFLLPSLLEANIYGINILRLEKNYNQTRFQCFAPSSNGLQVDAGSITTIIVTRNSSYHPPTPNPEPKILLDYRRFVFNATHKTIAWTFVNNQLCASPITFTIQSSTCDTSHPTDTWITPNLEYSLPLTAFVTDGQELLFVNITARSTHDATVCATTSTFRIYPNVTYTEQSVPLGNSSCLVVPTVPRLHTLYAVWPDGNGSSCYCPLCNNSNCILSDCQCYGTSSFAPTLMIEGTNGAQLCWSHLDNDRNNSNVHFFTEMRVCDSANFSTTPMLTRTLTSAMTFVVRGAPLPPSIIVSSSSTEVVRICFRTYSYYPVNFYEFNVTDFMGDRLLEMLTINGCKEFAESLFSGVCSPFNISAKAYNQVGGSNTSWISHPGLIKQDRQVEDKYCSCIQTKITFSTLDTPTLTTNTAQLQFNCTKTTNFSEIINVTLKLHTESWTNDGKAADQQKSILCDGNFYNLQYYNLSQNTQYTINSIWKEGDSDHLCMVTQFLTSSQSNNVAAIASGVVCGFILVVLAVTIGLCICLCVYVNKSDNTSNYNARSASRTNYARSGNRSNHYANSGYRSNYYKKM